MARLLPGEPEEHMSARFAKRFREACSRCGVQPIMYISEGRYTGDEEGAVISQAGVVVHMVLGLRALHANPSGGE